MDGFMSEQEESIRITRKLNLWLIDDEACQGFLWQTLQSFLPSIRHRLTQALPLTHSLTDRDSLPSCRTCVTIGQCNFSVRPVLYLSLITILLTWTHEKPLLTMMGTIGLRESESESCRQTDSPLITVWVNLIHSHHDTFTAFVLSGDTLFFVLALLSACCGGAFVLLVVLV